MKMCVFGLNHSNLSCGALPRAPGWLCRPTKPKPETRNPAAEWAKSETQAAAEKRNPKRKPGRNPVRAEGMCPVQKWLINPHVPCPFEFHA